MLWEWGTSHHTSAPEGTLLRDNAVLCQFHTQGPRGSCHQRAQEGLFKSSPLLSSSQDITLSSSTTQTFKGWEEVVLLREQYHTAVLYEGSLAHITGQGWPQTHRRRPDGEVMEHVPGSGLRLGLKCEKTLETHGLHPTSGKVSS